MKKFQLPVIGGIRKVLVQPSTTPGTTITEVGSGEITLAQLALLITQIQAQQQNTGGGNIGDGTEAFLAVGPGLSGGGPMLGTVQLRVNQPPVFSADDGADGDPGPPGAPGLRGPQGVQGPPGPDGADGADGDPGPPGAPGTSTSGSVGPSGGAGPAGPALFMLADDGQDGDLGPPGPPGPLGATGNTGNVGPTGGTGPAGPAIFLDAEPGADGDQGPPGIQGAKGSIGLTGGVGPTGPAIFLDAEPGADGDPGPMGPPGVRGLTGPAGNSFAMMPEDTWTDDPPLGYPSTRYQEGQFTGTLTGVAGVVTGTFLYVVVGQLCTVSAAPSANITSGSNATTLTVTGLPSICQPKTQFPIVPCFLENNGLGQLGAAGLSPSSGTITFYASISTGSITTFSSNTFAATGTKGMDSTVFTYTLQ